MIVMEGSQIPFLPYEAIVKEYSKWDCSLKTKTVGNLYFKCLEGQGKIEFVNGNKFNGEFVNGLFQGPGEFVWSNGIVYQGDFHHNQITGQGTFLWPDGSSYHGGLLKGYRQGFGEYHCVKQKYSYTGTWAKGMKKGKGKLTYEDGSVYEGQFNEDKRNGQGKMIYCSKNEYEGQWQNDQKHGKGTMNWFNFHQKYKGEWENDTQNGYGEYFWYDGKLEFKTLKNVYKGSWKNGQRCGFGAFMFCNGLRFEGEFVSNNKQGVGIMTDEFGFSKVQFYANNRAVSLLQRKFNETNQCINEGKQLNKLQKVAKIKNKTLSSAQNNCNSNYSTQQILKQTLAENEYKKYIDFKHPQISENLFNCFLRLNTKLKSLYKAIGTPNTNARDINMGMIMENYWKALREAKIFNASFSISDINRIFSESERSYFSMASPNIKCLEMFKADPSKLEKNILSSQVRWSNFMEELLKHGWDSIERQFVVDISHEVQVPQEQSSRDIHDPHQVILFRHFVCLLIHTANIYSRGELKDRIQSLVKSLQETYTTVRIQQSSDCGTSLGAHKTMLVPQWTEQCHKQLISELLFRPISLFSKIERTVEVRQIYAVFNRNREIFRDFNDVKHFIEGMEKYLNVKGLMRKIMGHTNQLNQAIRSPLFNYIMDYQLIQQEVKQLVYSNVSSKIHTTSQEGFKERYHSIIQSCIMDIKESKRFVKAADQSCFITTKSRLTQKDKTKQQLIEADAQARKHQQQRQKERNRSMFEREQMSAQDHDIDQLLAVPYALV